MTTWKARGNNFSVFFGGALFLCAFFVFVPSVEAAVGDVYTARAPGTSLVTDLDATEQTLTYDTEVQTSADVTRQSGNQAFRIQNSGRYLIITNTRLNYAQIANNNRHVVRTLVKIGGTALPSVYGMASGYGRDSGSADEDGAVVVAYVDHTVTGGSGDDITVHIQNFGDTGVSLADQFANQSGIQIIRLPDNADYLQVKNTTGLTFTGTMDFSLNDPAWNEFGWTSQDVETDSSVLEWVSGNDVTLKSAGHYMVIYSVRADTTGSARKGATYRLKLSDTEVPASRVVSYMRGSNGSTESWVQWAGIVEASASGILNIDWGSASETAGGSLTEAAMTVVKLPDGADYLRMRYDANRPGETAGAFPFNQEDEDDLDVHDNASNNSRISGDADNHDWLLFGSWFLRNVVSDNTRTSEHFRWFRTGTDMQYGSGLSYTRGNQSTTGVPAGGRNAVITALDLGASEYIEFNMRLESGQNDQKRDFIANQVGITGVALDTLVGSGGALSVDIVDGGGSSVASPAITMGSLDFSFASQIAAGILGIASEKVRVENTTATPNWTLEIAATDGPTALWDTGSVTYDFNDAAESGRLEVDAGSATATPQSGCSTTGVTLGAAAFFDEGTTDSITVASADGTADTDCFWDFTDTDLNQDIPAEQETGTYNLDLTLTAS